MKDLVKAKILRQKIKNRNITPETYPNTFIRLSAICNILEGLTQEVTAKFWKTNRASVVRWTKKYLKNESIDDIIAIEKKSLNSNIRDTSKNKEHAKILKEEIAKLDQTEYPNTFKRLSAVYDVLEVMTYEKAEQKWNISNRSIARYKDIFTNDTTNGVEIIKGIEKKKLNNEDTSN